jgi:hypothetical protein
MEGFDWEEGKMEGLKRHEGKILNEEGTLAELTPLPEGFIPLNEGPYFRVYPTHPAFPLVHLRLNHVSIGAVRIKGEELELLHSLAPIREERREIGKDIWYEGNRVFWRKKRFGIEFLVIYLPDLDVGFCVEGLGVILDWRHFLPGYEEDRKEAVRRFLRDAKLFLELRKMDRKVLEAFREKFALPEDPLLLRDEYEKALDLYHWRLIQRMAKREEEFVRKVLGARK